MRAIRCSCGAVHAPDAVEHIGRQYGLDGEYMDLGNCPTCGTTLCMEAHKLERAPSRHPPAPSPSDASR